MAFYSIRGVHLACPNIRDMYVNWVVHLQIFVNIDRRALCGFEAERELPTQ